MDRTTVEVFASDGLTCVPLAFQPKAGELGLSVQMKSGAAKFASLQVHNLKSIWK
jgi:sucrose-6-phosphate hydrolase SacC (GH32 family)